MRFCDQLLHFHKTAAIFLYKSRPRQRRLYTADRQATAGWQAAVLELFYAMYSVVVRRVFMSWWFVVVVVVVWRRSCVVALLILSTHSAVIALDPWPCQISCNSRVIYYNSWCSVRLPLHHVTDVPLGYRVACSFDAKSIKVLRACTSRCRRSLLGAHLILLAQKSRSCCLAIDRRRRVSYICPDHALSAR